VDVEIVEGPKKDQTETAETQEPSDTKRRAPVVFITSTDVAKQSYFRGYHDAIKDLILVALLYGLVLYLIFRQAPK